MRSEDRPSIRPWQHLTGADFRALDRERTVAVVSVSPLEVHGPHLPVVTDIHESEALAKRIMERVAAQHGDIEFLHLPPVYVATDVVPQPGSVQFRSRTIRRVLEDLGRSLCRQGIRNIWLMNFHGGPRHFVSMEVAAERVNRRYGGRMVSVFSLMLNRLTGGRTDLPGLLGHITGFTREGLEGDSHAGAVETSMMLHLLGEHVSPDYRGLDRRVVGGLERERGDAKPSLGALILGLRHKLKYYERETYAGSPALASPEAGAEIIELLAGYGADGLDELWRGAIAPSECHSPLWKVRWLLTSHSVSWAIERLVGYRTEVW
jgi:creatinine amidohydrolase